MKELLTGLLVGSGIFLLMMLMNLVIMPPVERVLGRILPWWLKAFLTSVAQGLFAAILLFAGLGFFATSGQHLMRAHPVSFLVTTCVGTVLFLALNMKSSEFKS